MNKKLKQYLYMLVGKELTYEDKEKILSYFNDLKQENDRMRKKYAIAMTMMQSRINKAIKYMEKNTYDKNGECGYTYDWDVRELYKILKGEENGK